MDQHTAALAGVLHDIGKFWQRAESHADEALAPGYQVSGLEKYGRSGAHATWSTAFMEQYVSPALLNPASVLFHHSPQDADAGVIALADRLASMERLEHEWESTQQPRQQVSVFSKLAGESREPAYWPLLPLNLEEDTVFPSSRVLTDAEAQSAYKALWQSFTDDAQTLAETTDIRAYIEGLLGLLKHYAWSIPSAFYNDVPDISLYDHSRVTGALAACLAVQDEDHIVHLLADTTAEIPVAALVEGDISGVQRFIYTITAKGAAKSLRGRSMYLQLLTEAAARYILRALDLPMTNLIYVGGGHFYLLVPPRRDADLEAARQAITAALLNHHDGDLYLALGQTVLHAADFTPERFALKWRAVSQTVAADKRRRFAYLHPEVLHKSVFAPRAYESGTEQRLRYLERDDAGNDDLEPSQLRESLEKLGQALSRSESLVLAEVDPTLMPVGGFPNALAELGMDVGLVDGRGDWTLHPRNQAVQRAVVLGLQSAPSLHTMKRVEKELACPVVGGLRHTVNVSPRKNRNEMASFSDMQRASHGIKRLGVLRMDVDNLGHLFAHGFERGGRQSAATLARVGALSSAMSLYFEGWVGMLCRQINATYIQAIQSQDDNRQTQTAEVEAVQAIYSGGDDLFIVGRWDVLPLLADTIQRDFTRFSVGNPQVHVSAGITLHGGKYPIYQAAGDAEDALDAAKDQAGKNCIMFLGQPTYWHEWPQLEEMCNELVDLVQSPDVGRNLLHVLMNLHTEYLQGRKAYLAQGYGQTRSKQPQTLVGPWVWHGTYQLTRLADRTKDPTRTRIIRLRDQLSANNFQMIRQLGLAARWAEALTKREQLIKEEV